MTQRDGFLDFVRGICIIVVLFVHSQGGWNYVAWDYYAPADSFNFNSWFVLRCAMDAVIPVFFFMSGYMLSGRKISLGAYYKKRFLRVGVPFILWSAVYSLVGLWVYGRDVTLESFLLGTNGIQLYFLFVMVQLMVLTPFLLSAKNKILMLAVCMLITLVNDIYQLSFWKENLHILSNEMILCTCFVGYYYLGHYFRVKVDLEKWNTPKIRKIAVTLLAVSLIVLEWDSYWRLGLTNEISVPTSFNSPVNIVYSVVVILNIMLFKNQYRANVLSKRVEWIGIMSMEFFAVHWLFMKPMEDWVLVNIPYTYMWLINIVIILATAGICYMYILAKQAIRPEKT